MNIPGYNPSHVLNPYVFADYGQPQRRRSWISPVVMQTAPPSIRDPYLDAVVEALEGEAPTGGGAYVGGHLAPGSQMLGSYNDRSQRPGLRRGASLVATISSIGIDDTQARSALEVVSDRLRRSPLVALQQIEWGSGNAVNYLFARIQVRMSGTDAKAIENELVEALQSANTRLGGGALQLAAVGQAAPDALLGQSDQEFGNQLVQALFSERPESLVIQPPVRRLEWWERTYLGVPIWALVGLGVFAMGTAGWAYQRRPRRRPRRRRRR